MDGLINEIDELKAERDLYKARCAELMLVAKTSATIMHLLGRPRDEAVIAEVIRSNGGEYV